MIVYLLFSGIYEGRNLLGVFSSLDNLEDHVLRLAFRGDRIGGLDIDVEGVDGADIPMEVRDEVAQRLDDLRGGEAPDNSCMLESAS